VMLDQPGGCLNLRTPESLWAQAKRDAMRQVLPCQGVFPEG